MIGFGMGVLVTMYSNKIKEKAQEMAKKAQEKMDDWKEEVLDGEEYEYNYDEPMSHSTTNKSKKRNGKSTSYSPKMKKEATE